MELLVLTILDWRLRSITPLSFLSFFACKLDSTGTFTHFIISRATEIILSNIQGILLPLILPMLENVVKISDDLYCEFSRLMGFLFEYCPQMLAFLLTGHHALLQLPYSLQLMKFLIGLLLILSMLNHGVKD